MGVAIGLMGMGIRIGQWRLRSADRNDAKSGAFRIETTTQNVNLFFAANTLAALCLFNNGHVESDDPTVIVHSLKIQPMMSRSPRGAPGRTGKIMLREVSIEELMTDSVDSNSLFNRFREETAL